jgi:hypothetical protein
MDVDGRKRKADQLSQQAEDHAAEDRQLHSEDSSQSLSVSANTSSTTATLENRSVSVGHLCVESFIYAISMFSAVHQNHQLK